jgi:hypothetical protein
VPPGLGHGLTPLFNTVREILVLSRNRGGLNLIRGTAACFRNMPVSLAALMVALMESLSLAALSHGGIMIMVTGRAAAAAHWHGGRYYRDSPG